MVSELNPYILAKQLRIDLASDPFLCLEAYGWHRVGLGSHGIEYWIRPGSRLEAALKYDPAERRLHVLSGNAKPFVVGESYGHHGVLAALELGRPFAMFSKALKHRGRSR